MNLTAEINIRRLYLRWILFVTRDDVVARSGARALRIRDTRTNRLLWSERVGIRRGPIHRCRGGALMLRRPRGHWAITIWGRA